MSRSGKGIPFASTRFGSSVSRFWARVQTGEGCWMWLGAKGSEGYGNFYNPDISGENKYVKAHRFAYEITYGSAEGMCVCHRCDNPACVRPDHLFLGTVSDNNRDRHAKGRSNIRAAVEASKLPSANRPKAEKHHLAKLTREKAADIRRKRQAGATIRGLAREYGVDYNAVWLLLHNVTWKE